MQSKLSSPFDPRPPKLLHLLQQQDPRFIAHCEQLNFEYVDYPNLGGIDFGK
jgi:hypothetical protein